MIGRRGWRWLVAISIGVASSMLITGTDWGGLAGTYLPCRRNWAWLPSYLPRASPIRATTTSLGTVRVKLCYGSPSARGRRMLGGPAIPYGQLWRTGANEATTLRLSGPLLLAGIPLPAGKVSIYSVPGPETWLIVANRSTGQWGLESEYTAEIRAAEIGRTMVTAGSTRAHTESLSMIVEPGSREGLGTLRLRWETTEIRIPLEAQRQASTR